MLWFVVAIPVLLLLLLLSAMFMGQHSLRRSIKTASTSPCPKCGNILGRDIVLAAKAAYAQKMREVLKEHSNIKFRTTAEWQIECPQCSFILYFYPNSNKLQAASIFANPRVQ